MLSCFAETIQDASQDSLKGAYLKYVPDGSYIVEVDDLDYSDTIQDASQDSLKRVFLKYVPDGSYIVKVGDIGYSDKNIAKSWLIIYAKTNEKCDGEDEKGILVLHQTHENECYVACEDSNYFDYDLWGEDINYGDGRISVSAGHPVHDIVTSYYECFNGEWKLVGYEFGDPEYLEERLDFNDGKIDCLTGRMFLKNGCYVGGFKEKNPKKCEVDIDLQYLQDFLNEDFTVYDSLIYFYQHCEFSEPRSHFYYGYRWSEEDLDSLKRLFLTYLPDSTNLLDVVDLDVQDEIIEQGWLLVTRCERQEWDTKDDGECYNPNFRGAIILFKNKTGEIYKYFEREDVFTPESGPGGLWCVNSLNGNLIVRNDNYGTTIDWYEFVNGEFKLFRSCYKADDVTSGFEKHVIDIESGTFESTEDIMEYVYDEATDTGYMKQLDHIVVKGKVAVDYLPDFLDHSSEINIVEKKRVDGNVTPSNP